MYILQQQDYVSSVLAFIDTLFNDLPQNYTYSYNAVFYEENDWLEKYVEYREYGDFVDENEELEEKDVVDKGNKKKNQVGKIQKETKVHENGKKKGKKSPIYDNNKAPIKTTRSKRSRSEQKSDNPSTLTIESKKTYNFQQRSSKLAYVDVPNMSSIGFIKAKKQGQKVETRNQQRQTKIIDSAEEELKAQKDKEKVRKVDSYREKGSRSETDSEFTDSQHVGDFISSLKRPKGQKAEIQQEQKIEMEVKTKPQRNKKPKTLNTSLETKTLPQFSEIFSPSRPRQSHIHHQSPNAQNIQHEIKLQNSSRCLRQKPKKQIKEQDSSDQDSDYGEVVKRQKIAGQTNSKTSSRIVQDSSDDENDMLEVVTSN